MKKKINKNKKINKSEFNKTVISKRTVIYLSLFFILIICLTIRIAYIQFINGQDYKEAAYNRQTINKIISPKRGSIYDSTGKSLAMSANVDTVTINPSKIVVRDSNPDVEALKSKEKKEKVAKAFSDIFALNYDETLEKLNSSSSVETIIKKVEKDKILELKNWMKENNIYTGINIDEDIKRYYPYNDLASNVIGFCGTDNQGLEGVEANWDKVLTGTSGKIVTYTDSLRREEIPTEEQTYIAAENGSDVYLTIDYYIQSIAEKYLEQAIDENNCELGGNVIIMAPSTGDILAMATSPSYDLNSPFVPNTSDAIRDWDNLSSAEKTAYLNKMWRNKAVSDLYEPGSTFKILTAAIALEENIVETDTPGDFVCTGYQKVSDTTIACWRNYRPHGYQSLRLALQNSCNPAFIQLGQKIGVRTLYKYYEAFNLFSTTGSSIIGEEPGFFYPVDSVADVELATMCFGQRIGITPLQLVNAVCAIANNGILMQPRLVKQTFNKDTSTYSTIEPKQIRRVLSEETCSQMKSLLQSVVTDGTGGYAAVDGYSIGGKTGTSEPPVNKEKEIGYTASYIALAPSTNTQVVVLVTLYKPQGANGHNGGQIAGPVVSQILSEILPYLGIASDNESIENDSDNTVVVPDVKNKTLTEANKILESAGFEVKMSSAGNKNELIVSEQVPKSGNYLLPDSTVCLYSNENDVRTSVNVPNLKGMSAAQARNALKSKNLNISLEGSGTVISQDFVADSSVEEGTIVKVILKKQLTDTH